MKLKGLKYSQCVYVGLWLRYSSVHCSRLRHYSQRRAGQNMEVLTEVMAD